MNNLNEETERLVISNNDINSISNSHRSMPQPIPANRLALDAQIQAAAEYQRKLRARRRIYYIVLITSVTMITLFILSFVAWIIHNSGANTAIHDRVPLKVEEVVNYSIDIPVADSSIAHKSSTLNARKHPTRTISDPDNLKSLLKRSEMESDEDKDVSDATASSRNGSEVIIAGSQSNNLQVNPLTTTTIRTMSNNEKGGESSKKTQSILSELTVDSSTFTFIEYFLRLNLHASTAKIIQAYEVSNPQLTLQFEKRSKNVLTVDSWVDVDALQETENTEESILEGGFKFSGSGTGMNFPVGKIDIQALSSNNENGGKQRKIVKRLMLCKVAVGRAYNAADDFAKIAAIPDGYDSFVIDNSKKESSSSVKKQQNASRASRESIGEVSENESSCHEAFDFIVKDSNQILPTFVVVFEFDPEAEKRSRQKVTCENCERRVATVFCQSDAANLCDQCDNEMHSSKLAARHVRVPLEASGAQTFSSCRIHPDKIVEFFCPSCSRPVCVHCKMVGHHSTGDAARHKLITIAEAFKSVAESANAIDPILESRKAAINAQQQSVEERAKQVIANATAIQTQLDEIYARAQVDLKALLKKKLNVLRGDSVELNREMSEIAQLEAFLDYQKSGPNATQFILDWAHHQRLRSELHSFPFFRETIDVLPDIRVNGSIQVHVESALNGGNGGNFGYSTADMSADKRFSIGASTNSAGRARATPTIDLTAYKVRKATDYVADIPQSYAASSNQLAPNSAISSNSSPQYSADERKSSAK